MAKLIELKEAAERLGITPEALSEMRDRNEIFGYRDGASWKFKPEEIERVATELGTGAASDAVDGVADALGGGDDLIDVSDLKLGDDSDDDVDSILVTEEELGRSDESTSSTIIGKASLDAAAAESDIQLADADELSVDGASDLNLAGDSDLSLDGGSDLDLDMESTSTSDVLSGDSNLLAVDEGGTGSGSGAADLVLDSAVDGSSLNLAGSDSISIDEELSLDDSAIGSSVGSGVNLDSAIDLDLDDELDLAGSGTGSDVTLGASDSGINLTNPSDSGISLEDVPSDLGSGIDSGLDLGDGEMIELEADAADPDDVTDLQADDEFMLTPVAGEGDLDEESDDSGSQVIALDSDEFDESAPTMLDDGGLVEEGGFEPVDDLGAAAGAAAVGVAATATAGVGAVAGAAVEEGDFSAWNIVSLAMLTVFMGLSGLLALDVIRNIWSWNQPFSLNNTLMDFIVGML